MSTVPDSATKISYLTPEFLSIPHPWYACLLPLQSLPVHQEHRSHLLQTMTSLLAELRSEFPMNYSVFLQLDELHQNDAIQNISRYGQQWGPELGMGLYPEAPPPRYWTGSDFTQRKYTDALPALVHSVVALDSEETEMRHACEIMTGTGGLIQVLHSAPSTALKQAWHSTLQPSIQESGLAAYPIYIPLFRAASFAGLSITELDRQMAFADVYLRESFEDKGILLIARRDPRAAMRKAGFAVLEEEKSES